MHDEHMPREDEVIDDVLGENPRASQLRLMRAALEERRSAFKKELDRGVDDPERARLRTKIKDGHSRLEKSQHRILLGQLVRSQPASVR